MAMMVEVNLAYSRLNMDDRRILFYKYAESLEYAAIAQEMGINTEDAARMRHNRAIKKLINRIGGVRPFLDADSNYETKETNEEPSEESE